MRSSGFLVPAFLLIASTAVAQPAPSQPNGRPSVLIPRVDVAPRLEDYAKGEQTHGVRIVDFLQRDPGDLAAPSETTEAYLSYDDLHIYAVFVCRASSPSRIRARVTRREQMFGDDHVALFLDTFNDKQRAYMFFSSPLGIQADGITTDSSGDDMSFDTVWQSRGLLTDFGYVVLIAVPFKSLRFPAGSAPATWGVALSRHIPEQNEYDFFPGITRRVNGFAAQFAEAHGLDRVSPGRNIQLIPYGTFTSARFLDRDRSVFDADNEGRAGIDAKLVIRDAVTVDSTLNPDFSQVESDEPQVTVNQRFEVFFPERRPFFLENANYFETPINLFFSRRIRDPQFGVRATGKLAGWAIGALASDDRGPGHVVAPTDPLLNQRSGNALFRARREFGQSSVGALFTARDFGPTSNRIASIDSRVRLNPAWFFDGQAAISDNTAVTGAQQGSAYAASLSKAGRKLTYSLSYSDVDPGFRAPLGFIQRTDIRQVLSFATLRWRPKSGPINAIGPNSFVQYTWDSRGELTDYLIRFPLQVDLKRQSGLFVRRAESMERFDGLEFREHENYINFYTSYLRWMDFSVSLSNGTRPNFFPAEGQTPFAADFRDASVSFTFRPTSRLLVDETYLYSHLQAAPASGYSGTIFDNHIVRTRVNYQFSRELSLRAIFDYDGVLSNEALVALNRTKHVTADLLLTYLLHPGTALYVGVTDGFDNVELDPVAGIRATRSPTTSTGRQFVIKRSYLFRF